MYQALFSSGQRQAARKLLNTVPKDDPHVRFIVHSCRTTYKQGRKKSSRKTGDRIWWDQSTSGEDGLGENLNRCQLGLVQGKKLLLRYKRPCHFFYNEILEYEMEPNYSLNAVLQSHSLLTVCLPFLWNHFLATHEPGRNMDGHLKKLHETGFHIEAKQPKDFHYRLFWTCPIVLYPELPAPLEGATSSSLKLAISHGSHCQKIMRPLPHLSPFGVTTHHPLLHCVPHLS
jgi:hypothetical protein